MHTKKIICVWLVLMGAFVPGIEAAWMQFAGGPALATGTWPAGNMLTGTATVTASNFVNGNNLTPLIGLTPFTVGPLLSADYFATGLVPNPVNLVPEIATPYNDTGDKYHVVIDFSGTTGGSNPGVLPAGSIFAMIDLDITENYRKITATNAANVQIVTPWISGPNGYFDMNTPMIPQGFLVPNPTLVGPVGGVYDMLGITYNFDVGMWLFQTTQDVKTIAFDMELGVGGNSIGGGGAGWAFYTARIPEPTALALVCAGMVLAGGMVPRRRQG